MCHFGEIAVLVYVDQFSEFLIARKLKTATAIDIRDTLLEIFCQFGIPEIAVFDNGANLNAKIMLQIPEATH